MAIITRDVDYEHDGVALRGQLALDDATDGPRPLVLVSHAWAGRSPFEDDKARALAELGYAGFALDLYGAGVLGNSTEENSALMTPFIEDRALLQDRLRSALAAARAQDEVDPGRCAAIGFCFGGLCVLDLARCGTDLRGVVSVHGLFMPADNVAGTSITAKVLALHGWDDPMATHEQALALTQEMTAAGADWQLHVYGNTMHAFTNPAADDPDFGTVYDANADRRAWQSIRNFLAEVLA